VRKNSIAKTKRLRAKKLTVGIDLGDRSSRYCILDEEGDVISEGSFATTKTGVEKVFEPMPRCRVAIETGCHSPWVSRQLTQLGQEVIVANARSVQLISQSKRKDDRLDARTLARLVRIDASLLCPVRHRGAEAQAHLAIIRARDALVRTRTLLVNAARGLNHSESGYESAAQNKVGLNLAAELDPEIRTVVGPLLAEVETLNQRIAEYNSRIEKIAQEHYPEVGRLKKIKGVGTLIALTFVLTVDDPHRFRRSRDVGCYLGLRPGRRNSGNTEPQMHISKEGDSHLRRLMVQGAHYILGAFGEDCDLRRWGLKLAERGGKNAKKRAVIAVARKLAILLHKLWVSGEVYDPLRNSNRAAGPVAA
jgi:transposase